jgi:hypothetical protein
MGKGKCPSISEPLAGFDERKKEVNMAKKRGLFIIAICVLLAGCASVHDNLKISAGKITGDQFAGMRYPFKVSVPPHWKMTTEFPDFLKNLGYEEPGPNDQEVTELYLFNPSTESNLQIDFTPANRGGQFSQESIEALTTTATESLKSELEKEHGQGVVNVKVGPTEPISLKGVQFAAKKYVTYTIKGVNREQGWIYGFSEPNQIFILYMILGKGGENDRQDMKKILDSFEVISKK